MTFPSVYELFTYKLRSNYKRRVQQFVLFFSLLVRVVLGSAIRLAERKGVPGASILRFSFSN